MIECEGSAGPPSLVHGVEEAVCQEFGIAKLRHMSALRSLRNLADCNLPGLVFRIVSRNWIAGRASDNVNRSRQNWRWTLNSQISSSNKSPEVCLERAIAAACQSNGNRDWANQIPVASGLLLGAADGRRAIDLAQRGGKRSYELIELKIASDTPLYATVELLIYGSLWLLARPNPPAYRPALLEAERIDLRVLAPAKFYAPFDLVDLECSVDGDLRKLGRQQSIEMTFGFDVLPARLALTPPPVGNVVLELIATRRSLHGNA